MAEPFGARLWGAVQRHGHLCVGIDPHAELLRAWGLSDDAAGAERFGRTVVEALAGRVAIVKPQSAFFERFGAAGIMALERTLAAAREAGLLAVLDVKRGDIGSTAIAYAQAYLDPASPLHADALTVSPYLGFGSLRPFLETAVAHDAGVFVLALTSNPEGGQVQHARGLDDGRTVAGSMLAAVAAENGDAVPQGSVGVVVGATVGAPGENLAVNGPILVPGIGAQGAQPADLSGIFGPVGGHVIAHMSRSVLAAGPDAARLADAAAEANAAVTAVLRGDD